MKVMTIGTFDLFHEGHLNLLSACQRLAGSDGTVLVGVNADEFVREYKGSDPVQNEDKRVAMVSALSIVSEVLYNFDSGKTLIDEYNPNILVIGSDWAAQDYYKQIGITREQLEERGVQLVYVPYTEGISTTMLRRGLREKK